MHTFTIYAYTLYWTLKAWEISDEDIALSSGLTVASINRLKNSNADYFNTQTVEKLEKLVRERLEYL